MTENPKELTKDIHNLTDQLNVILVHSQLLLMKNELEADTLAHAEEINNAGERLADSINKLSVRINEHLSAMPPDKPESLSQSNRQANIENTNRRILIAEDNPANQSVLRMQLNALGYEFDITGDGNAAFIQWQTGGYGLILADINMPGMDGLKLTQVIRSTEQLRGGRIPIIALTAVHYQTELNNCLKAGMDDILPKPVELDNLRLTLQKWLPLPQQSTPSRPSTATDYVAEANYNNKILDTSALARVIGSSDSKPIRNLIELFITSARAELPICHQHLRQKQASALALSMHKLKSSGQAVGALYFAEQAENLENSARQGHLEDAAVLLTNLEHAISDVETALSGRIQFAEPVNRQTTQPHCIQLVDNEATGLQQIAVMLTALGVKEIVEVKNTTTALQEIERHGDTINLLLCDLNLPPADSIDFLHRINEKGFEGCIALMRKKQHLLPQSTEALTYAEELYNVDKPSTPEILIKPLNESCKIHNDGTRISVNRSDLPEAILEGLRNDEFKVYFQPKVDIVTLKPVGIEALARWWRHGNMIAPEIFIPVAEQHGLIDQLSEMLLTKALIGASRLAEAGFPLSIAVNLSSNWVSNAQIPDFIQASIHATGLKVDKVILEITKTGAPTDLTQTIDILTRLHRKGFRLSIDDFGIGYSSVEQLHSVPFSEIKLDFNLIREACAVNAMARTALTSSVEMATKLNLSTVAKGIETQQDLDLAMELGCNQVQGWFIARPMHFDELIEWLQTWKPV